MKWRKAIFAAVVLAASKSMPAWGWSVWTYHGDNTRQGAFTAETTLTPSNVNVRQFGKLFSVPVAGSIFAQPLYVPGVYVNGAIHNVVYVATQYSAVYALDADTGAYLWVDGLDTESSYTYNCNEADGIYGTPVIDTTTSTLYVVVASRNNGRMLQQLFALDITSGAIKARTVIQPNGFDATYALERGALTLANGAVYVPEAVLCDEPYNTRGAHGWEMIYGEHALTPVEAFNTSPGGYGADIWGGGAGAVVDQFNNVYFETGNGDFNASVQDYGDSVLKLSPFGVSDYFTPMNQAMREAEDEDMGSGGDMQLPGGEMLATGKVGDVYILNQWNMGKYSPSDAGVVQEFDPGAEMFTTPVFWNSTVYMAPAGGKISAYSFANGQLNTTPTSQSKEVYPFPGGALWVTSNGSNNGIIWALQIGANSGGEGLYAYDATNLSRVLWSSNQDVSRDWPGPVGSEFRSFMCANGKCYVTSGNSSLEVYGLLP